MNEYIHAGMDVSACMYEYMRVCCGYISINLCIYECKKVLKQKLLGNLLLLQSPVCKEDSQSREDCRLHPGWQASHDQEPAVKKLKRIRM